jgi:hypothetical protein
MRRSRGTGPSASAPSRRHRVATNVTLWQRRSASPRRSRRQQAPVDRFELAPSPASRSCRDRGAEASPQHVRPRSRVKTASASTLGPMSPSLRAAGRPEGRLAGPRRSRQGRDLVTPTSVRCRHQTPTTLPTCGPVELSSWLPPVKPKLRGRYPGGRRFGRQNALPTPTDPARLARARSQAKCHRHATTTRVAAGVISTSLP